MRKRDLNPTEYINLHRWLKDNFGKAEVCENSKCNKKSNSFEWALIKGANYERNRDNFIQLCASCHRKYDLTTEQLRSLRRSRRSELHKTPIEKIKLSKGGKSSFFNSTKEASEKLGINRRSIYNVLAGRAKKVGGYTVIKL